MIEGISSLCYNNAFMCRFIAGYFKFFSCGGFFIAEKSFEDARGDSVQIGIWRDGGQENEQFGIHKPPSGREVSRSDGGRMRHVKFSYPRRVRL